MTEKKTIIVWYRNDLRVNDHPALAKACEDADFVLPVFILNDTLLTGPHASPNRNRFLLQSLADLKKSLKDRGANLVIRTGRASDVLQKLAQETSASAVYCTADFTPYALKRDRKVMNELQDVGVELRGFSGRLVVSAIDKLHTKAGTTHKIFTPFYKNWINIGRRELAQLPSSLSLPSGIEIGDIPRLETIVDVEDLSPNVIHGGETAGRERLKNFLDHHIDQYDAAQNDMAGDYTSRLSAYLHFGCISAREAESMLPPTDGGRAWQRQLCWRDFYNYTLFHNPDNAYQEYQERFRKLSWLGNDEYMEKWKQGKTGYPIVDAAMRQLQQEGWMHNRGRLIVGSFFTKDLWLNWRDGEAYFMHKLIDGDEANNNGNWQWIASVGVDPAPVFRRMYNPTSQGKTYDPSGEYIRRYVPELKHVSSQYLYEPWTMDDEQQQRALCIIGRDYPEPIVNHKVAREFALEQYRSV